ncbi:MAG: caspase family protein [Rhodobacteraceae bacterium]|nr:caspase family protein [Paracoccaceae bacterium]
MLGALLGAVLASGPAWAESRIALVVGNGGYGSVASLDNPVNDARLIGRALEVQGFKVTLMLDAGQIEFNRAIAQFGRDLRDAGPDATGLFYYAGHGVQSYGTNYLLPVDAGLTDAADLGLVGVPAENVLRQMSSARNKTNIFILDACRNNPFEKIPDMNDNGLAEMKAPTGTFLSYSTAPGAVALDGQAGNSPFSKALAVQIERQGVPIEEVFKETRVAVLAETGGMQTPWDTSSLTSAFYFSPPKKMSPEEVAAKQLWDSVKATRDPVQIMLFLRGYGESSFAEEARVLLGEVMAEEMQGGPTPKAVAAPVIPVEPDQPVAPAPADREIAMLEKARTSGLQADYEAYLAEFPNGTYSELAKFELSTLADKKAPAVEVAVATPPQPATPELAPEMPQSMFFETPLTSGVDGVKGQSIAQLIKGSPLFPPIDGIPDSMWKGQTCSNCHNWTREALCEQGKTYLVVNGARALAKNHPLGGPFKQALKVWAGGGCQ